MFVLTNLEWFWPKLHDASLKFNLKMKLYYDYLIFLLNQNQSENYAPNQILVHLFRKRNPIICVQREIWMFRNLFDRPRSSTLRKLVFYFLSNWMGYDRGDNFPLDFEPNGFPFGSKSKGKLSPRSYPIQCERKWKYSFLSAL